MNFRTLFTPAALAGLLALPGAASALDAIPASCLKCRQAPDDTAFITCLYECLADLKTAPGASSGDASKSKAGTPSADSGKSGKKTQADGLPAFEGGWTVYDRPDAAEGDQARSAELLSRSAVSAFFQRVQPVLVLARKRRATSMPSSTSSPPSWAPSRTASSFSSTRAGPAPCRSAP